MPLGDAAESFLRYVRPLQRRLGHVARQFVAREEDGRDLIQETLLRACRAFRRTKSGPTTGPGVSEGPTMQVRSFTESDEPAVIALWREVFPDAPAHNDPRGDIQRKLETQPEGFLVATIDGLVVGTAMAGFDGHRGWVYYLAVHPDHRRNGIGSALMASIESQLASAGCTKLNLQVRASNSDVVAFYRNLGYAVEERVSMGKTL